MVRTKQKNQVMDTLQMKYMSSETKRELHGGDAAYLLLKKCRGVAWSTLK